MPVNVYKFVFKDPDLKKLAPSTLDIETYTTDTVNIIGCCVFYLVHPDTKKLHEVTFFVAIDDGSVLLSCTTTLALRLIQSHKRLDYLSPKASLITSSADHPKKIKSPVMVHSSREESAVSTWLQVVPKLVTSKEQILQSYCDVFDGIGCFPSASYYIQLDPSITPKQTPCWPIPVHLKGAFKQELDKMLKAGVLKTVHQAIPMDKQLYVCWG